MTEPESLALPRSPFLDLPGAVEGEGPDAGTPAHYGGFLAEQRPLARGLAALRGGDAPTAIVDQGHLAVLRLEGDDRLSWLDSLTSQSLAELRPGESAQSLLLDINGRIEHAFAVVDDGRSAWLVTEGTHAASLAKWLDRMRFMLDVKVVPEHERYGVVATLGNAPDGGAPDLGAARPDGVALVWTDPWSNPPAGGITYSAQAPHPGDDWLLRLHLVERPALAELARRASAGEWALAGNDALEALRVAAWRPRLGRDVDARTIPHELDWIRSAVHLTKGCYRGQETVAKVHNLGHPPRRVVALDFDGALPAAGAPLHVAGDEARAMVGRVTSVAQHFEDGPIGLAIVKRRLDPQAVLAVDIDEREVVAAQHVIVPTDAGRTVEVPRMNRVRPPREPRA